MAIPLVEVAQPAKRLFAHKAYGTDSLRQWFARRKTKAVIPALLRKNTYPLGRKACRRRNVIERLFGKLTNWRRIAAAPRSAT